MRSLSRVSFGALLAATLAVACGGATAEPASADGQEAAGDAPADLSPGSAAEGDDSSRCVAAGGVVMQTLSPHFFQGECPPGGESHPELRLFASSQQVSCCFPPAGGYRGDLCVQAGGACTATCGGGSRNESSANDCPDPGAQFCCLAEFDGGH